jgi:hypothetical protein
MALRRGDRTRYPKTMSAQMREQAERYCGLIERAEPLTRDAFVSEVAESLAALISHATHLPRVEPTDTDLPDGPTYDQWKDRFMAVGAVLGDWNAYWTTLDITSEEAVLLPVADDLADIWRDLRRGLDGLQVGARVDDVVWEWRFGFCSHWGRHATDALRVLHSHLAD